MKCTSSRYPLPRQDLGRFLCLTAFLALITSAAPAAVTVTQRIDPPEANVGDVVTVSIMIQNGSNANFRLPNVDGLQLVGTGTSTNIVLNNGAFSSALTKNFQLQPLRPGDFIIPAFDIPLSDGGSLHVQAMKLHVLDNANAPSSPVTVQPVPSPTTNVPSAPSFNPNGPVVMPPDNGQAQAPDATAANINVPTENDGRPAKVFIVITPQTTDAYVGQSIPLRIEFYLRLDSAAQQNSLPTIKGSDFLMNNLSLRPMEEDFMLMNEAFHRETWVTAISAPKSGDFPLQMERDTYWSVTSRGGGPFGNFFFNRQNLAHQPIPSNQLTMHIHALPDEGRPAGFTGAIGQLKVEGNAQPLSVAVGEPVTLHFKVSGQGNFDYVRSPSLADDPAWKNYVPSSKINYEDESRTHGVKTFEQAVIPQKNGTLPLPQANFSYFDPTTKQYVTIPIDLPAIAVTGSALASGSSTPPGGDGNVVTPAVTPQTEEFLPNRLVVGSLRTSLVPAWRQPWFWIVQGSLVVLLFLGALFSYFRNQPGPDDDRAGLLQRQNSLHQEIDAMTEAMNHNDARAFFLAARHAVQLHLGASWRVQPEALTLGEIRQRDPQLAGTLEPLFTQADEIIYSGGASGEIDLVQWGRHVHELLQPQPQTA